MSAQNHSAYAYGDHEDLGVAVPSSGGRTATGMRRVMEQQLDRHCVFTSNGKEELAPHPHQRPHSHDDYEDPSAQKSDWHWHNGGACITKVPRYARLPFISVTDVMCRRTKEDMEDSEEV